MNSVVVNKIADHYKLTCGICQETYNNPKVLPCLHSFCLVCLDKSIRSQDRTLTCPSCHHTVSVPAKGVEAFPINFFINNMLTVLAVQNPTKCTNCEDSAQATARCLDCVENLCTNCVHAHKRIRQTKDHRILSFDEILANEVKETIKCPSFCGMHPREVLKYFCETCDEAICRDCAIYEHRDHIYVDLKEAIKRYRSTITSMLDSGTRKIPVVRSAVEEVKEVRQNLDERVESVKKAIHETIQGHIRELEEQEADLMNTLDNIYRGKEKVLTNQQEILELDLANLLSSSDFTENVLRYGNEAEVMLVKPQMVSRLAQLNDHESQTEPEDNDIVDFTSNNAALSKVISKLGKVTTSSAFPLLTCADGPGLIRAKAGYSAKFTIFSNDRNGEPCGSGNDPLSVKIRCPAGSPLVADILDNDDGTYTASFTPCIKGDHQVNVTLRGKHIKGSPFDLQVTAGIDCEKICSPVLTLSPSEPGSKASDDTHEPWGVAIDRKGQLVVTDHYHHCIQIYDASGKIVTKFGIRGKGDGEVWYPAGVAVDTGGNIYVSDHGNNRIQVFTKDGEFVRKFGSKGTGQGSLKGPCGVAVDSEDRVLVADRDNHRINVFDVDGNPMFRFGGYGDADGKMNCPRHVSVAPKGEILVSDAGNFRIQVFDSQGNFQYKFGEKGNNDGQFSCPAGISTDSEGNMAVADLKNLNVQIFGAGGEFIKKIGQDPDSSKNGSYFSKPTGLAISENGNIAVADRGSHRVQLF